LSNQWSLPFGLFRLWGAAVLVGLLPALAARAGELPGLRIAGETFTFADGTLSFRGMLVRPHGNGPFPAVLISHGMGSTGERFGRAKARVFAEWGFVCIAPDYAHSERNGDRKNFGASAENIRRARKCLDILQSLPEVDPKRLCAYGNSMGAFVTVGLAAEEPGRLAAAAITAGGISPARGFPAPSKEQAAKIRTPFCILHGADDTTVPPERSQWLADVLTASKVPCERHVFAGVGHDLHIAWAEQVNARIEAWLRTYSQPK
jgi:dienelactone hydrolase